MPIGRRAWPHRRRRPAWLPAATAARAGCAHRLVRLVPRPVAPEPDAGVDCWIDDRLEYRFGLGGRRSDLPAPRHSAADGSTGTTSTRSAAAQPRRSLAGRRRTQTMLATPLRFAGMPADRYWQFEDGAGQSRRPARSSRTTWPGLLLVEFATVYGNDWLVVPVDVPLGSFTAIDVGARTRRRSASSRWSPAPTTAVAPAASGCSR